MMEEMIRAIFCRLFFFVYGVETKLLVNDSGYPHGKVKVETDEL